MAPAAALTLALLASAPAQHGFAVQRRDALTLNIPPMTPTNASQVVDHGYMAFAIAGHTWQQYSGSAAAPNTFSRNLIQTVADRIGAPVHVRVGGTSQDYSRYDATQSEALKFPAGYVPGKSNRVPRGISMGPSWFEGFGNFPGVQWTYTAHFANNSVGMMENSVSAVQQLLKYVGSDLESLEIGNEINFYTQEGTRPRGYGAAQYVNEWNAYQAEIQSTVLAGTQYANKPLFRVMQYYGNFCPWCVSNTFNAGMKSSKNVMSVALHNYMVLGCRPFEIQRDFMNHTRVRNQLEQFRSPVEYLQANYPDIPLHLSEVNSATNCQESARGALGVFGNALWMIDYLLYGMTVNIARMNVQQSTYSVYTSWRPAQYNDLPPAVLPPWYAHPFVADVIGTSGDIRVANIDVGSDTFSAYAIYDANSKKVYRIALINLLSYTTGSATPRPATTVTLKIGNQFSDSVTVDRLTAAGSNIADASQITWKGASWTRASNGKAIQGRSDSSTIQASRGIITVSVNASQAILLTLH